MEDLDNFIEDLPNQSEIARLNKKLDDVRDKFDEIIGEWRTSGDIPRCFITSMYEILGVKEG
jgi:uncharacterized protein YutD